MTATTPAPRALRVGIFGGSFDPPHAGHLLSVLDAQEALALDLVQVVPAGAQPLKPGHATTPGDRLAMASACFADLPGIAVDAIEIERGGLSYMIETVEAYGGRWPDAELFLLLGADAAAGLDRWREPERLLRLAQLIVLDRAGASDALAEPWREWSGIRPPRRLAARRIDVSSSEVRSRVAAGHPIRGFVPDSVAAHIASAGLYLSRNAC
jgi:nicotinate-nucleotide adenylyltransferase